MAETLSEIKIELPVFTEVNGIRYELGTWEIPVGIKTEFNGTEVTVTGEIDPDRVLEDVATQFRQGGLV